MALNCIVANKNKPYFVAHTHIFISSYLLSRARGDFLGIKLNRELGVQCGWTSHAGPGSLNGKSMGGGEAVLLCKHAAMQTARSPE